MLCSHGVAPRNKVSLPKVTLRGALAALSCVVAACRAPAANMAQLKAQCASSLIVYLLAAAAAVTHASAAGHRSNTRWQTGAGAGLVRHSKHKSRRLMQVRWIDRPDVKPDKHAQTCACGMACGNLEGSVPEDSCAGKGIMAYHTSSAYKLGTEAALSIAALQGSSSPADAIASIRQGAAQMLGATLAGWLVLEQNITPALWAGISGGPIGEAALMQAAAEQVPQSVRVHVRGGLLSGCDDGSYPQEPAYLAG